MKLLFWILVLVAIVAIARWEKLSGVKAFFIKLIRAAYSLAASGLETLLEQRNDNTERLEIESESAKAERLAREQAEAKARKQAEAERIAREKAEEEARQKAEAERIAREKAEKAARKKAAHNAKIEQFNASIRQELTDLEAAFQKAQEEEVAVIAALKAL